MDEDRLFPIKPRNSSLYLSGYKKRIGRRGVKMCREVLRKIEEREKEEKDGRFRRLHGNAE